jgi:hypothetical protein
VTATDPTTFTVPAVVEGKWLARGGTIARYDCHPHAAELIFVAHLSFQIGRALVQALRSGPKSV